MRILSGICGAVLLLVSALFTLGTSLAAPVGMIVARRRALRRGRPFTRFGSWLGAAIASSIAMAALFLIGAAFIPRSTLREIQKGAAEARVQDTARTPEWIANALPATTPSDSAALRLVNSTPFLVITGAIGLGFACLFLGTIAGSVGWAGTVLIRYAASGSEAP